MRRCVHEEALDCSMAVVVASAYNPLVHSILVLVGDHGLAHGLAHSLTSLIVDLLVGNNRWLFVDGVVSVVRLGVCVSHVCPQLSVVDQQHHRSESESHKRKFLCASSLPCVYMQHHTQKPQRASHDEIDGARKQQRAILPFAVIPSSH